MTVTITKLVSKERAVEYVRLGRWGIIKDADSGVLIKWSGGEHEHPPEPECDWDRMWRRPFDRPELIAENGNPDFLSKSMPVLRDDVAEHQAMSVGPKC